MGLALVLLDARPVLAGVLFGLLAYKPQFGLLIPLVLIATGRWKTFAAPQHHRRAARRRRHRCIWYRLSGRAFLEGSRYTREVVLEAGDTGWHKIQSIFAWARMWGAPVAIALTPFKCS